MAWPLKSRLPCKPGQAAIAAIGRGWNTDIASDLRHRVSGIGSRASGLGHRVSGIGPGQTQSGLGMLTILVAAVFTPLLLKRSRVIGHLAVSENGYETFALGAFQK